MIQRRIRGPFATCFVRGEIAAGPRCADVAGWIAQAREGIQEALGGLLQACRGYLLAVAQNDLRAMLRARVAPADVVQETLWEACHSFPQFQGHTGGELLAWLRGILRHNLARAYKKHARTWMRSVRREVSLHEMHPTNLGNAIVDRTAPPDERAEAQERDEALWRALRRLPEHYRQALLLHTCDGLTFAEVGGQLGCSAEAARKVWKRAAEELAAILGNQDLAPAG